MMSSLVFEKAQPTPIVRYTVGNKNMIENTYTANIRYIESSGSTAIYIRISYS